MVKYVYIKEDDEKVLTLPPLNAIVTDVKSSKWMGSMWVTFVWHKAVYTLPEHKFYELFEPLMNEIVYGVLNRTTQQTTALKMTEGHTYELTKGEKYYTYNNVDFPFNLFEIVPNPTIKGKQWVVADGQLVRAEIKPYKYDQTKKTWFYRTNKLLIVTEKNIRPKLLSATKRHIELYGKV